MGIGGDPGGSLSSDDLQKYGGDASFPAKKDDSASKAGQNDALKEMMDHIKGADKQEFSNVDDLQSTLGNLL